MIDRVKARMNAGEDVPDCLAKTMILTQEQEKLDWEDMCMLSAVFIFGGVYPVWFNSSCGHLSHISWKYGDSTEYYFLQNTAVILWFLARIASHPEVQARANAELDKVVGRDRWPNAEDEHRLPYIRAIIKEVCCCARQFRLSFSQVALFPSGDALPPTILDTSAALLHRRLCV
jgi:hypothetical protein